MSPIPQRMEDHWWQRPGRTPGREQYHWHVLFDDQQRVRELAALAQRRLAGVPGLDLIAPAVVMPVEPLGALDPILEAVQRAAEAAGCAGHADTSPWVPHVSVAYPNRSMPADPVVSALGKRLPEIEVSIGSVSLVAQTQVGHSWQWRPVAEVTLRGGSQQTPR